MASSRRALAAAVALVVFATVLASGARAQNCKWEAPQMCLSWYWLEAYGGVIQNVQCPNGSMTCVARVRTDIKINGYKIQGYGWQQLANAGPSPGDASFFPAVGCVCVPGESPCECIYPSLPSYIQCPSLANPNTWPDCPS